MTYTTASEIRAYLGIASTSDDSLIGTLIGAAQKTVESYTGRVFEWTGSASLRYYNRRTDVQDLTLFLDADAYEVESVLNGDGITLTSAAYTLHPRNSAPYYAISLKPSGTHGWEASTNGDVQDAIVVSGKWAYSATPPADVKQATIRLVSWLYRQKDTEADLDRPLMGGDGVVLMPASMPKDVMQILAPYRRQA